MAEHPPAPPSPPPAPTSPPASAPASEEPPRKAFAFSLLDDVPPMLMHVTPSSIHHLDLRSLFLVCTFLGCFQDVFAATCRCARAVVSALDVKVRFTKKGLEHALKECRIEKDALVRLIKPSPAFYIWAHRNRRMDTDCIPVHMVRTDKSFRGYIFSLDPLERQPILSSIFLACRGQHSELLLPLVEAGEVPDDALRHRVFPWYSEEDIVAAVDALYPKGNVPASAVMAAIYKPEYLAAIYDRIDFEHADISLFCHHVLRNEEADLSMMSSKMAVGAMVFLLDKLLEKKPELGSVDMELAIGMFQASDVSATMDKILELVPESDRRITSMDRLDANNVLSVQWMAKRNLIGSWIIQSMVEKMTNTAAIKILVPAVNPLLYEAVFSTCTMEVLSNLWNSLVKKPQRDLWVAAFHTVIDGNETKAEFAAANAGGVRAGLRVFSAHMKSLPFSQRRYGKVIAWFKERGLTPKLPREEINLIESDDEEENSADDCSDSDFEG